MNARQRFTDRLPAFGKCLGRKSLTLPLILLGAVDSRGKKRIQRTRTRRIDSGCDLWDNSRPMGR